MPGSSTLLQGLAASPGVAIGRCWPVDRRKVRTPRRRIADGEVARELARLRGALEAADRQLESVRTRVERLEATEHTDILDMHRLMLKDEMLVLEAQRLVADEHVNAEWAVKRAVRKIKSAFHLSADAYFRERRADLDHVGERIIKNLMGEVVDVAELPPDGSVVVAHDLSPADTALLLHERKVAAFVTDGGSKTSHTAIVARALEVPAVVGTRRATALARRGDLMAVDGTRGVVILSPTAEECAAHELAREAWLEAQRARLATRELPSTTLDGITVRLVGNIEFAEEVTALLAHGGEGIGLYRTEFLFMGRPRLPTEEEHCSTYRGILEAMTPRPVTIRTFDLGGDKLPSGARSHDENPALGLRAIRYCLRHPELFRPQLRGLLRAGKHGNLRIMFPMVADIGELRAAKRFLAEAREELRREGIETALPPTGIMVELPSAVMVADRLARECDFLSLGTNDLIQYTMAIDRQNRDVAHLYRPLHLAVLRMLKGVCEAARSAGIPVSICGEMAGDPIYAPVLLGLGLSELSMNGASIPAVKDVIRSASAADGRRLLERMLELTAADEIQALLEAELARAFPTLASRLPRRPAAAPPLS